MSLFMILPIIVCVYEAVSLILPLKLPMFVKIIMAVILFSGLMKMFVYRRTSSGFELIEYPYWVTFALTVIYNFVIVVVFMLLVKDIVFILWKIFSRTPFPASTASLVVLVIGLCATFYGTYEGLRVPGVNVHDVKISGLGREFDGMRIAMMVDIHADELTDREFVRTVTEKTNALSPDVILIPGDFVDGTVKNRYADIEPLKDLKARFGVYGVTGNHEYYYDYDNWTNTLWDMGIKILMNEHVEIVSGDDKLIIAGLPDPTGGQMGRMARDIDAALKDIPENVPVILMDHQPRFVPENAERGVALQVSGHTHGGQMPGIYQLVKRANRGFVRGWYDVGSMRLYVSPGTSQWNGFALRLFDPAEITLFTLHSED